MTAADLTHVSETARAIITNQRERHRRNIIALYYRDRPTGEALCILVQRLSAIAPLPYVKESWGECQRKARGPGLTRKEQLDRMQRLGNRITWGALKPRAYDK